MPLLTFHQKYMAEKGHSYDSIIIQHLLHTSELNDSDTITGDTYIYINPLKSLVSM